MIEWSKEDSDAAFMEGWNVWDCAGSMNGPWQICVLEEPYNLDWLGYEDKKFADDNEVWVFVRARAAAGSELHRKALCFVYQHNRQEYDAIMKWEVA